MNEFFNNFDFLGVFKKRIKLFIIVSVSAVVLSYLFSSPFFIKPVYKSTAILYPSNLSSFSEESATEQMIQLFNSDDIKFKIAKKYNLLKQYEIDSNYKYHQSVLLNLVERNVNIYKTEYESVNIDVKDYDAKQACDMVNSLIDMINAKILEMHRARFAEKLKIWKDELAVKTRQLDSVKKQIDSLRLNSGIIDFDGQLKEASRQFFTMTKSESPRDNNYLSQFMKKLQGNGAEIFSLTQSFNLTVSEYNRIKLLYEGALVDYNKELKYTNIVAKPYVSDKSIYPIRWLIVLVTLMSALIVTVIAVVMIEKNNQEK